MRKGAAMQLRWMPISADVHAAAAPPLEARFDCRHVAEGYAAQVMLSCKWPHTLMTSPYPRPVASWKQTSWCSAGQVSVKKSGSPAATALRYCRSLHSRAFCRSCGLRSPEVSAIARHSCRVWTFSRTSVSRYTATCAACQLVECGRCGDWLQLCLLAACVM